jgi:hypothetical protein
MINILIILLSLSALAAVPAGDEGADGDRTDQEDQVGEEPAVSGDDLDEGQGGDSVPSFATHRHRFILRRLSTRASVGLYSSRLM